MGEGGAGTKSLKVLRWWGRREKPSLLYSDAKVVPTHKEIRAFSIPPETTMEKLIAKFETGILNLRGTHHVGQKRRGYGSFNVFRGSSSQPEIQRGRLLCTKLDW